MGLRPAVAVGLLSFAVACGAARVSPRVVAARRSTEAPREPFMAVSLLPGVDLDGFPTVAAETPEGEVHLLWGGLRATVTPRGVAVGLDHFAAAIAAAVPVSNGWVFVAGDGVVAASETFTGPLRRLGELPLGDSPPRVLPGVGRLAVVDTSGTLWTSEGQAPTPARVPEPVSTAVFADTRWGAAITQRAELLWTEDGGETWHRSDLAGLVPWSLLAHRGILGAQTSEGFRPLVRGEARLEPAEETPRSALGRPWQGDLASVREAVLERYPGLLSLGEGCPRLAGATLRVEGLDLVTYDRSTGRALRRLRGGVPLAQCRLHGWGPAVALTCPDGAGVGPAMARSEDGETFTLVAGGRALPDLQFHAPERDPLLGPRGGVFSDDGRHAAALGAERCPQEVRAEVPDCCRLDACACAEEDRAPPPARLCVLVDGARSWRVVPLGALADDAPITLDAMHGSQLLLRLGEPTMLDRFLRSEGALLVPQGLAVLDVTTGEVLRPTLPRSEAVPSPVLGYLRWLSEGTLYGLAISGEEPDRRALAVGRPGATLALRPLPMGALDVELQDADHGLATGARAEDLWQTLDGGHRWDRVTLPLDGSLGARGSDRAVRCDAHSCLLGRIRLQGWGEPRASGGTVLAAGQGR
ncbi:MAG: hypothetical protein HY909_09630 [Deltaproteobacteria bacterium]|nr:hypothetical protein [Deltaproteobacteria bacterium]